MSPNLPLNRVKRLLRVCALKLSPVLEIMRPLPVGEVANTPDFARRARTLTHRRHRDRSPRGWPMHCVCGANGASTVNAGLPVRRTGSERDRFPRGEGRLRDRAGTGGADCE